MAGRHYGYYHFPQVMGDVFSLFGSAALLCLLLMSSLWAPLKIWAAGEEFLVTACTSAWLIHPWEATDERCSAVVGFKIGSIGLIALAILALRLAVRPNSVQKETEQSK